MTCPECGLLMNNLGNLSGIIMTSYPPQWVDTYVCKPCKLRTEVHVTGENKYYVDFDLSKYKSI